MVVPVDDNDNLHIQLRNNFFENLEKNGNHDDYEEIDLDRLRNDDHYCRRFILHKKGDFNLALAMVHESLKWRKSFGVKDVNQASIPIEFFQAKAVFPYNTDKEGNPIIMILVRYHKKAPEFAEALRKFVIYWVELMEEQTNGGQMTVIMSCAGAGLSNLDLDLIKFLITLFRSYYPHSLAHILIFEMPWILNPAWKIIKAWLPEDFVDKIKFVNKVTLQDYVSEDNLPVDMGGTNTTEYEPPASLENDVNSNNIAAEPKRLANGYATKISKGNSTHALVTDDYAIIGGILKICPASELVFAASEESTKDVIIKLTCVSNKPVSYKVKTNNIESYRVKPSIGIIEPESTIEINVILQDNNPLQSDKFLIMGMEVENANMSTTDLSQLWKSARSDIIADHKLKCVSKDDKLEKKSSMSPIDIAESLQNINLLLTNLDAKVQSLHTKQSSLQFQQTVSLIFIVFLFLLLFTQIMFSNDSSLRSVLGFL